MGFLPTVQTILNDTVFFILGGLVFDQIPVVTQRAYRYVFRQGREEEGDRDRGPDQR